MNQREFSIRYRTASAVVVIRHSSITAFGIGQCVLVDAAKEPHRHSQVICFSGYVNLLPIVLSKEV
jgi:hypothetical protein